MKVCHICGHEAFGHANDCPLKPPERVYSVTTPGEYIDAGIGLMRRVVASEAFKPLPKNWDSYGAEPVTQETCDLANKMIEFMASIGLTCKTAGTGGELYFFDQDERHVVTVNNVEDDALSAVR